MSTLYETALATFDIVPDSEGWELAIQAGLTAAESLDDGYWIIGRLALRVQKRYGEDTIGKFAAAINVPKKSVTEYRTTCRFWPEHIVTLYRETCPNVPYTIYRDAMLLKREGQEECSQVEMAFIETASVANWSTQDSRDAIAALLGKPTPEYKKAGELIAEATETADSIILKHSGVLEDAILEAISAGEIKVVIYAKRNPDSVWEKQKAADILTVAAVRNLAPKLSASVDSNTPAPAKDNPAGDRVASAPDSGAAKRKTTKRKGAGASHQLVGSA